MLEITTKQFLRFCIERKKLKNHFFSAEQILVNQCRLKQCLNWNSGKLKCWKLFCIEKESVEIPFWIDQAQEAQDVANNVSNFHHRCIMISSFLSLPLSRCAKAWVSTLQEQNWGRARPEGMQYFLREFLSD